MVRFSLYRLCISLKHVFLHRIYTLLPAKRNFHSCGDSNHTCLSGAPWRCCPPAGRRASPPPATRHRCASVAQKPSSHHSAHHRHRQGSWVPTVVGMTGTGRCGIFAIPILRRIDRGQTPITPALLATPLVVTWRGCHPIVSAMQAHWMSRIRAPSGRGRLIHPLTAIFLVASEPDLSATTLQVAYFRSLRGQRATFFDRPGHIGRLQKET